ncbi:flavin reductase family protein [Desmospora profundinema]|uniref:Flavin reductase (DIM6/NTAB) family NADH-FMN oxidoreductase RutF n=1 Tax=Desmospora profundinema TaxID=1571184 RepID=A0ABU1IIZ3_9BACL|nr:flavin reductase family protein [Desmospora profundinema]MDR6224735.1 flavin reductase (DIM6/NTAB) family NADH-FMN oxidoreductase RutF [Desmospora profundinema]
MQIDPSQQSKTDNYKLLIGSVLPRPIAFVTTLGPEGAVNAAPFSFYTVVSTDPPMVSITCSRKPGGVQKDTARNIAQTGEFVVQVVDGDNVERINQTATDFPPEIGEAKAVGFQLLESARVKPPRIAQCKVHLECRLHEILPMGGTETAPNADVIIGEVVCFHVRDDLYHEGRIDTGKLDPVGRLAGTVYGKVGETFSMPRLTLDEWKQKHGKG